MEYLKYKNIAEQNKQGIGEIVQDTLTRLKTAQSTYPNLIMEVVKSGRLEEQIALAQKEAMTSSRSNPEARTSDSAGAYFLNEDVIGGSREPDVIDYTNRLGSLVVPGWSKSLQKLKLSPGIGFVEAPPLYRRLIDQGLRDEKLTVNYTAPFGTSDSRKGIKSIMDSRIDPEGDFFPDDGVFVTEGATEGIDLFMETVARLYPSSRVIFLGLSYYTGPFSAQQKGLTADRLMANPINVGEDTRFFPSVEEITSSLPKDTRALVLTMPNNPNGETYSDSEMQKLVRLAKETGCMILFDGIFENMYFDERENFRSRPLQIAAENGSLDRIVVVDSLSKTKNLPGERIGFIASTNREFSDTLTDVVLSRRCNPRLILGPLLRFEGLARQMRALQTDYPEIPLRALVDRVMGKGSFPFDKRGFEEMYRQWNNWNEEVMRYYASNLEIVRQVLKGEISGSSPDEAAFNTFVRTITPGKGVNNMDYLAKLMFTLGTYTQVGPCFGLSQKIWDEQLGIWSRITYACSRKDLTEALIRLVTFSRYYAEKNFGDPDKFPTLQISYDNLI